MQRYGKLTWRRAHLFRAYYSHFLPIVITVAGCRFQGKMPEDFTAELTATMTAGGHCSRGYFWTCFMCRMVANF